MKDELTDRQKQVLKVSAGVAAAAAIGFVAVEVFGISSLGPQFWRIGPQSFVGYALVGAPVAAVSVLILYLGFYALFAVAAVFIGIASIPRLLGQWLHEKEVPGLIGIGLHLVIMGGIGAAFVLVGGGLKPVSDFWLNAGALFALTVFAGTFGGGFLVFLLILLLQEWGPRFAKELLADDDSPLGNALIAVGSLGASYLIWQWIWARWLFRDVGVLPNGVPSTPLAAYVFMVATTVAFLLTLRGVRVFTDRHRLLPKSKRTPVWSDSEQLDPEPVGSEYWSNEPAIGWRVWNWDGVSLQGAVRRWDSATKTAICRRPAPCPDPPGWDCNCGIYAYKDPDSLGWEPEMREVIWGRVGLAGRVIEHEDGYRASEATIQRLWVLRTRDRPDRLLDVLAQRYPNAQISIIDALVRFTEGEKRRAMMKSATQQWVSAIDWNESWRESVDRNES